MATGRLEVRGRQARAVAVAVAAAVLAAAAGCGGSGQHAAPPLAAPNPYAYDRAAPLRVRDAGRVNAPSYPIAVRDVSYAVPGDGRVPAYLALPPGKDRVPAVVWLHGSGEGRERFLLPAAWFAGRRAVGMTITLPSSSAGPGPTGLTPQQALDRTKRIFVADVVAVRRALDLLQKNPRVDGSRLGLVGWSLGARVAAVAAGADPRLGAVTLMSGGANPVSDYVAQAPAALRPQVRRTLTAVDPLHWIGKAQPGTVLLQNGRKDQVVPQAALLAMADAAPKGTTVLWYPTGHELNAQAYRDQFAFLARKLKVAGPPVPGAQTGP